MDAGTTAPPPSFGELLWKDLRLDSCQWEERPTNSTASPATHKLHRDRQYFELDALVGACFLAVKCIYTNIIL